MTKTLTILGATGATGERLVRQAAAAGHAVRAVEHECDDRFDDLANVEVWRADVLSDDLTDIVGGADAVVSCLGVGNAPKTLLNPPPLYTEGTVRLIEALRATGGTRLLAISASFVATRDRGPAHFRLTALPALDRVFTQMAEMERILRVCPDLDWTAVRPGWLLDADPSGDYLVQPDVIPPAMIRTRTGDLAQFLLACATDGLHVRETPAIARMEPDEVSSPAAMLREVAG